MMLRLALTAACLFSAASALVSTPAAYGVGKPSFDAWRAGLPAGFNVVEEGGYYSLSQRYLTEVGKKNYAKSKATLPETLSVINVGGFDNIYKLAADPKSELVKLVLDNLQSTGGSGSYKSGDYGKMDALIALLQSQGKGFSSVKVDGEWDEVLSRQGKKSTKSQKFVGGKKKTVRPTSNFNVMGMDFENTVLTPRGNGLLKANVKYTPVASNFDKTGDGKIVLRRIRCDITGATFKYKSFPKLSLPFLKKKGGYLDFLYMDDDIRITEGNRGGLFIHFKPEYYKKVVG